CLAEASLVTSSSLSCDLLGNLWGSWMPLYKVICLAEASLVTSSSLSCDLLGNLWGSWMPLYKVICLAEASLVTSSSLSCDLLGNLWGSWMPLYKVICLAAVSLVIHIALDKVGSASLNAFPRPYPIVQIPGTHSSNLYTGVSVGVLVIDVSKSRIYAAAN
ncbi:hypothetical protein AVEN_239405-1, partial [Araneus ventricosus]